MFHTKWPVHGVRLTLYVCDNKFSQCQETAAVRLGTSNTVRTPWRTKAAAVVRHIPHPYRTVQHTLSGKGSPNLCATSTDA